MSNVQFFERSQDWKSHMHEVHSPLWIRYLHNQFIWKCSLCSSCSETQFDSKAELEADLGQHINQFHSKVTEEEYRYLISIGGVAQARPSDRCPICETAHLPTSISESVEPLETRGEQAGSTPEFQPRRVAFGSDVKFKERPGKEASRIKRAIDDHGVENCIARHLKALALYFCRRFIDEGGSESDSSSSMGAHGYLADLAFLPKIDDDEDPSWLPSDLGSWPSIETEEIREMRSCVAENLEQVSNNRHYTWEHNRRVLEPDIYEEEWEHIFLRSSRLESDEVYSKTKEFWSGIEPGLALVYAAGAFVMVAVCNRRDDKSIHKSSLKMTSHLCLDFLLILRSLPGGPKCKDKKSAHILVSDTLPTCTEDL